MYNKKYSIIQSNRKNSINKYFWTKKDYPNFKIKFKVGKKRPKKSIQVPEKKNPHLGHIKY